ncbi:hypothetical protein PTTG_02700 [Puccinia triticina 1-1 BBBD Race 1]|uniref:Brix domain-containing protein n=2 Tax=Puccinia triticina TaxID=208348 RepID=A0A180GK81_PUCT1|nr:uncharacterized protein PtA15_6A655 [Puccinia triticina]OAV92944.1 hypothetical protein PTTG_02700 [Puccinia triticina 1-1 BBBD Race 1]WAQ86025.1 hypothetical protein PtA15_6A655 [Puccinia triticina]WAR55921.1 hypothetical protein PtB15_6B665 [Puccinia triticina]
MASRSAQATTLAAAANKKRKNADLGEEDGEGRALTRPSRPYKSKVLILCSRGITYRMRHLMNDLANLITHGKKDAKLDSKHALPSINELADLNSCNHALYFEARRHSDLYLWATRCPNGPSIRFHVVNVHTMDEMKMTGNCLKGSRPIVTFGKEFEDEAHWKVCKEVLTNVFAVPKTARKAKPFVDHIISFSIVDGKIWFRNYQILQKSTIDPTAANKKKTSEADDLSLTEIGPRFVLTPIKLFEGSFSGPCLWENKDFVPPIQVLKEQKSEAALKYVGRKEQESSREARKEIMKQMRPDDELEKRKVFA